MHAPAAALLAFRALWPNYYARFDYLIILIFAASPRHASVVLPCRGRHYRPDVRLRRAMTFVFQMRAIDILGHAAWQY